MWVWECKKHDTVLSGGTWKKMYRKARWHLMWRHWDEAK